MLYDFFGVDIYDYDDCVLRKNYTGLFGYFENCPLKKQSQQSIDKISHKLKYC